MICLAVVYPYTNAICKVYSFQLSNNNPREAQAREVIEAWKGEEYSLRNIVTEALISFSQKNDGVGDLTTLMLCSVNMFSRIEMTQSKPCDDPDKSNLSSSVITAVKNSAKSEFSKQTC